MQSESCYHCGTPTKADHIIDFGDVGVYCQPCVKEHGAEWFPGEDTRLRFREHRNQLRIKRKVEAMENRRQKVARKARQRSSNH